MLNLKSLAAVAALAAVASAPASGAVINYFTAGAQDNIPGLTGFTTTGDLMDGMSVTACFTGNVCENRVWADTGPGSGGVTGSQWSLSVSGDTFNVDAWTFAFGANQTLGQLLSLRLDGGPFTLFDRTQPSPGTPGSASGRDFNTALDSGAAINVTYIDVVAIIPGAPVGDLYHSVLIEFVDGAPRVGFQFSQDTDNDSRLTTPEPTTLALLGIAGLGLALSRRRRS